MAFISSDIGKTCPFCNQAKLVQYKSGKIGCGAYCWKTKTTQSKSDLIEKRTEEKNVRIDKAIENKNKQIAYFNSVNSAIARNPEGSLKDILKWRDDFIDAWRAWSLDNMVEDGTGAWSSKKQEVYNDNSKVDDINQDLQVEGEVDIKDIPF